MKFQKVFLFGVVIGRLLFAHMSDVLAFDATTEIAPAPQYDYRDDPYLLTWSFIIEKDKEDTSHDPETHSVEDKILNRWKEKQAPLWQNLPQDTFTINASAYTAAADECGKNDGITASGLRVSEKRTLACPPSFPFGTIINIEGMGDYRCEDRGGAIKGNHFDIYMHTKSEAFAFGRQHLEAQVIP